MHEAEKRLHDELNYRNEADNSEIFNALNPDQENVFAPKVINHLTTRRVLVTEWVDGVSPEDAKLSPEEGKALAQLGGQSVFRQIVVTGFFHSDPHSGNMLITPDKRICLLDWGQAGQITVEMRYLLTDFFAGITARNPDKVIRVAERMALNNRRIDRRRLEKEIAYLLNRYRDFGPSGTKMGTVGLEMLYIFGTNGIEVSPDYALLAKSVVCLEETSRALDPDFDIISVARPFLERMAKERWSPRTVGKQTLYPLLSLIRNVQQIPEQLQRILERVEDEDIRINMHHAGTENLEETFNASMNRLTVGIIIGSLLIGSSLIITTGVEPLLFGYPTIGILGFLVSGLLGLYIVISTLRKHR